MSSNSKEYNRDYYLKHREERKEGHNRVSREYSREHKEEISKKRRKPEGWKKDSAYYRKYHREYSQKARIGVLAHYGGGKLACLECGENRLPCLTIDHIDNNGTEHRKQIGGNIVFWLRKRNYPEGYQTLCRNCNWIKKVGMLDKA